MQIQGQIQSVKVVKNGNTNGRNWSIYEVMINGQKFKTFDGMFAGMIGQSGVYEYETTSRVSNGRTFTDNNLITPKPAAPAYQQPAYPPQQPVYAQPQPTAPAKPNPAIVEINQKLDLIISMLRNEASMPMDAPAPVEDEIDVSKIPF